MASPKTRMSAEQRRIDVLEAAVPEFAQRGLAGTSTEDIAARAGISQPYLFRLFPSKKALFLASCERVFDLVATTFIEAAEGLTGEAALDSMGWSYGAFLGNRELLMHQMHCYAACDDPEVRAVAQRGFGRLWAVVEERSGADAETLRNFFAMGMLFNVIAAMDLPALGQQWAVDCIPPQHLDDIASHQEVSDSH